MRVVFVQKFVPHYRLPFFEKVREILESRNITFILLYCEADPYEASKVRSVQPPWGTKLHTRHISIAGRFLYWAGVFSHLKKGDLVVVEHAAKLLDNYVIFSARQLKYLKMGYFGHGENFQSSTEYGLSALVKKRMLHVDRWFAYTEVSRQSLLKQSVQDKNITVVNNTLQLSNNAQLAQTITPKPYSCVFVGGLYALKLLPLLLAASDIVAQRFPEFELHLVGEGPELETMLSEAAHRPWLKVHGSLYGIERDRIIASSNAILMPGLVGLIAIDSFQFERPILTSVAGEHSPEIAYLANGENCLIDTGTVTANSYADMVIRYLDDTALQTKLVKGCRQSCLNYSIEHMAENFCSAIELQ